MLQIDQYTKIRDLGRGGMATVILAEHKQTKHKVAIKILNKDEKKEVVRRFFREARIIARLKHENIVRVFESNVQSGQFYIIMEYMEGGDLTGYLTNSVDLVKNLNLINQVLPGLHYIHLKGIVHRDVKPSNILLNLKGIPKLSDFGIAASLFGEETRFTKSSEVIGTMDYIAPEQKESTKKVDYRADIYSLGVILYEIITGRKPMGIFVQPQKINSQIPGKLNDLVVKTLQYDPVERYKNIPNLQKDLQEILNQLMVDGTKIQVIQDQKSVAKETVADEKSAETLFKQLRSGTLSEKLRLKDMFLNRVSLKHELILIDLLSSVHAIEKEIAIRGLGKIRSKKACKFLLDFLNVPYYNKITAEALGEIGCSNAADQLFRMCKSQRGDYYMTLVPLAKLGVKKAVPYMEKGLKDSHDWIRKLSLQALEIIGSKDLNRILNSFIKREKDSELIAYANKILWRLGL
jgi:serine/threonine protein kinase